MIITDGSASDYGNVRRGSDEVKKRARAKRPESTAFHVILQSSGRHLRNRCVNECVIMGGCPEDQT